jgi:hypothetical protein
MDKGKDFPIRDDTPEQAETATPTSRSTRNYYGASSTSTKKVPSQIHVLLSHGGTHDASESTAPVSVGIISSGSRELGHSIPGCLPCISVRRLASQLRGTYGRLPPPPLWALLPGVDLSLGLLSL